MSVMNYTFKPTGNIVVKSIHKGATPNATQAAQSYELVRGDRRSNTRFEDMGKFEKPPTTGCERHDNCAGHLCRVGNVLILPPELSANRFDLVSKDAKLATMLSLGRIDHVQYAAGITKNLMGKRGVLRGKATSFPVDGSIRMVISPDPRRAMNEITIPAYVARKMKIPSVNERGVVEYGPLLEGMYLIVVRPPCLGPGSCQPMKVYLSNTATCIGFPTLACAAYNADFDGDEIQGSCVTSKSAVEECKMWKGTLVRSYGVQRLVDDMATRGHRHPRKNIEPFIMDTSTVTYSQALDPDLSLNKVQAATGLKKTHCTEFASQVRTTATLADRFEKCVSVLNGKISKQSQQSNIGYICRQAKVASLNYPEGMAELPDQTGLFVGRRIVSQRTHRPHENDTYGIPAVRWVSAMCQRLMQEMLTTKSGSYDSGAMSPIQCFLTGEGRAIMVFVNGTADGDTLTLCASDAAHGRDLYNQQLHEGRTLAMTNSIDVMRECGLSGEQLEEVCCEAVEFVMCCAGREVTDAGKDAIVTMAVDAVGRGQKGLVLDKRCKGTQDMRWLYVCHSVYYSADHACLANNLGRRMTPLTLPERMLLANHCVESSLASVEGNEIGRSVPPRCW